MAVSPGVISFVAVGLIVCFSPMKEGGKLGLPYHGSPHGRPTPNPPTRSFSLATAIPVPVSGSLPPAFSAGTGYCVWSWCMSGRRTKCLYAYAAMATTKHTRSGQLRAAHALVASSSVSVHACFIKPGSHIDANKDNTETTRRAEVSNSTETALVAAGLGQRREADQRARMLGYRIPLYTK
eukprot:gene9700-6797_t